MNRTAVIYRPDEYHYILTLRYDDREAVTRRYKYNDIRDMMNDIMEHLGCSCPHVLYGEEYSGDVRGLLVAINKHKGSLSIKYNISARAEEIADIFRDVTINQLIG